MAKSRRIKEHTGSAWVSVHRVQRKVQMNNQSQASSQTSSGTVFIVQCIFLLSHCELMKSGFITMALIPPNAFYVCRTLN